MLVKKGDTIVVKGSQWLYKVQWTLPQSNRVIVIVGDHAELIPVENIVGVVN